MRAVIDRIDRSRRVVIWDMKVIWRISTRVHYLKCKCKKCIFLLNTVVMMMMEIVVMVMMTVDNVVKDLSQNGPLLDDGRSVMDLVHITDVVLLDYTSTARRNQCGDDQHVQ